MTFERYRSISRRRAERGQMVPLAALMALVILGGSALAFDLTVQTHDRRFIQNVVDSAALAGAQDLVEPNVASNTASMLQTGRQTAVATVLTVLLTSLGFSIPNPNYAAQAVQQSGSCGNNQAICDVDNVVFGDYTISVDTPPTTADKFGNAGYNSDSHYIEVTLRQTVRNTMGSIIGSAKSIDGGHAVAYHFGGGQQFGFALYTNTYVTDGNDNEVVQGNVYAYRDMNPSSQGHASFCAAQLSDGTQGNIVLGSPQWPNSYPSPDPAGGALFQYKLSPDGHDPDVVQGVSSCSGVQSGEVAQTGTDERGVNGAPQCPTSVQGVTLGSGSYMDSSYTRACVAVPAVAEPNFAGPVTDTGPTSTTCPTTPSGTAHYSPGYYLCTGNNQSTLHIDHPLDPGIYHIAHNSSCSLPQCADVTIDQQSGNVAAGTNASTQCPTGGSFNVWLCDVTFWLDSNATISIGNGETVTLTPYMPYSGGAPSGVKNDGKFPIYAPYGSTGQQVSINNNNTYVAMAGTVYMPGGTFFVGQNAFVFLQGQAIVNQWNVQSGNHPNPDIKWDATRMAALTEILRLVE